METQLYYILRFLCWHYERKHAWCKVDVVRGGGLDVKGIGGKETIKEHRVFMRISYYIRYSKKFALK